MNNVIEANLKLLLTHASVLDCAQSLRNDLSDRDPDLDPRILSILLAGHLTPAIASDAKIETFVASPQTNSFELLSMFVLFRAGHVCKLDQADLIKKQIEILSGFVLRILRWANNKETRVFKVDLLSKLVAKRPFLAHFILKELLSLQWGVDTPEGAFVTISLLRVARMEGLAHFDGQLKVDLISKKGAHSQAFQKVLQKEKSADLDKLDQLLRRVLVSADPNLLVESIRLVTENRKKSAPPSQGELELVLFFCSNCLKSSFPAFRNEVVTAFKKFFERLRRIFEHHLTGKKPKKIAKTKAQFEDFKNFMQRLLQVFLNQSRPETPFETLYVLFETLQFIFKLFGPEDSIYKGRVFPGSRFLVELGFCAPQVLNALCASLNNSADTHRSAALSILGLFPKDLECLTRFQVSSETPFESVIQDEHFLCRLVRNNRTKTNIKDIEVGAYAIASLVALQKTQAGKELIVMGLLHTVEVNFNDILANVDKSERVLIDKPLHVALTAFDLVCTKNAYFANFDLNSVFSVANKFKALVFKMVEFINRLITSSQGKLWGFFKIFSYLNYFFSNPKNMK